MGGVHGGMKVYRGSAVAARAYVEADRSRADDYYLAEGNGLAVLFVATPDGVREAATAMDGGAYERWVGGYDVDTHRAKGRLRTDEQGVRFVEVTVNGPKTWSLAAVLHPEVAAAYEAAQDRAASEIIGWLAGHATTRVGPRGRQVQVPVEEIEAAVVRHYTSRAGDPHRHLHLQVNARVWACGAWRGLHTVGVRDSLDAINGIGHAAVMTDPGFRTALAEHGYHLDPETGEVVELAGFAGAFSARARQIEANIDRYEARWRGEHPGEEPGPVLRQVWDRRAWAEARPDKVVPSSGVELTARWVDELVELGFRAPEAAVPLLARPIGSLDRDALVATALTRLGSRRSAWNAADARGEVEHLIATTGVVADRVARRELAEDLTARVVAASVPLLERTDVPEHVRALTSRRVVAVERDVIERLGAGGPATAANFSMLYGCVDGLDGEQRAAVALLAGTGGVVVLEGAAGAGKTATLAATGRVLERSGRRMVVVTPTRKAAEVVARQVGARAQSVAWLLYQHGYRWDADGRWGRVPAEPGPGARLWGGDTLVVDEAGMLDQDTARALLELAAREGARVVLVGDRHQLPAVGRGGVLDLAARYAPDGCLALEGVRRFTDPAYADLSLRMRRGETPGEVFDQLVAGEQVVVHPSEVERTHALAVIASRTTQTSRAFRTTGASGRAPLVVADTREQVVAINGLVHRVRVSTGEATDGVVTVAGERVGVGDRIATRRNDATVDVANREVWTVTAVHPRSGGESHGDAGGGLTVTGAAGTRHLPAAYVREHVELAYVTTVYGAQGETVPTCHVVIGDHTSASSAYVGMTRGRDHNVAHLVAASPEEARQKWVEIFARDRADLGPAHATVRAADHIERYGPRAAFRPPDVRPRGHRPTEQSRPYTPPASSPSRGIGF